METILNSFLIFTWKQNRNEVEIDLHFISRICPLTGRAGQLPDINGNEIKVGIVDGIIAVWLDVLADSPNGRHTIYLEEDSIFSGTKVLRFWFYAI